jgi:putative oxidoreductase
MTSQALSAPTSARATALPAPIAALFATRPDSTAPILRWTLAAVFFPHGAQKALGWFGGHGWDGTMGFLTGSIGLPAPIAALVILIELLAPLALVLGLFTRGAALGIAAIMAGAIATVHAQHGFFMNWSGAQAGEGFEFHLLAIAIALALVVRGGGSQSLDLRLARRAG